MQNGRQKRVVSTGESLVTSRGVTLLDKRIID